MRKSLQLATALVALLATPALAQNATPAAPPAGQQVAPAPQAGGTPAPASPAPAPPAAPAASPSGAIAFLDAQQPEETLASSLIGAEVRNAENQAVGEINDVLLAADGRLKAVVVGVGGFLGIAERDVAVPWGALEVSREEGQDLVLRLDVGREQLEQAPEFTSLAEREAAERAAQAARTPPTTGTGMGAPLGGAGAGGAVVPAPSPTGAPTAPAQ